MTTDIVKLKKTEQLNDAEFKIILDSVEDTVKRIGLERSLQELVEKKVQPLKRRSGRFRSLVIKPSKQTEPVDVYEAEEKEEKVAKKRSAPDEKKKSLPSKKPKKVDTSV